MFFLILNIKSLFIKNAMNIIEKVIAIRDSLPQVSSNLIDFSLNPIPPFCGKKTIKLIILGQDPTIRNIKRRNKIQTTLNLDNNNGALRKYIEKICIGLDLSLDNIYATNIYKYFYTYPPADTPNVLKIHLSPNIKLLESELSDFEKCPIITLGEPVLKLLTNTNEKVRNYWNYNRCGFHYNLPINNILHRPIFPFPHQPSIRKRLYSGNFCIYLDYMKNILSI